MKRIAIALFLALFLWGCSSSARVWQRSEGVSVSGFDGRYFYAQGVGRFYGAFDTKTGVLIVPPANFGGEFRLGFDVRERKGIDPDVAQAFVFPAGIPEFPEEPVEEPIGLDVLDA